MTPLDAAKTFMAALGASDADKAASVCSDDVTIVLPGGDTELQGKDAAKRLIRVAPPFVGGHDRSAHGASSAPRG